MDVNSIYYGNVFDQNWYRRHCVDGKDSYEAYTAHIAKDASYGDTGCLLVFKWIHPSFCYALWCGITDTEMNLPPCALRCDVHQQFEILYRLPLHEGQGEKELHLYYRPNHFDVIENITLGDYISSKAFIKERERHIQRGCKHCKVDVSDDLGVTDDSSEEEIFDEEKGEGFSDDEGDANPEQPPKSMLRGGRPSNEKVVQSRLLESDIAQMEGFKCECETKLGYECTTFMRSGQPAVVRRRVWGDLNQQERKAFMRRELERALSWDSVGGKWELCYTINYNRVCEKVWSLVHGFSKTSMNRMKRNIKEVAESTRKRGDVRISGRVLGEANVIGREDSVCSRTARAWFVQYADEAGEKMPTPVLTRKKKGEVEEGDQEVEIRLPQVRKSDLYEEYESFCRINREVCVKKSTFLEMWRKEFRTVKCSKPKGTFSMCQICAEYTGLMKNAATGDEYERYRSLRSNHWEKQRAQRLVYYENRAKAMFDKEKTISMIIDAMDQSKTRLPIVPRREKNDKVQLIKQKIMGVIVHGHGTYIYCSLPPVCSGANLTVECLWRTIMKLSRKYGGEGKYIPRNLVIQLDNASDNKAKVVLAFASYLIEREVFEEVSMNFLIVGHTHEDIDQYFSVISRRFRKLVFQSKAQLVVSFEDFQKETANAFTEDRFKPECVERVLFNHDFTGWLYPWQDKSIGNITKFRHFVFRKQTREEIAVVDEEGSEFGSHVHDDKAVMLVKEYMSSEDSEYKPNLVDWKKYGPVVVLREGEVEGEPELEEYKAVSEEEEKGGVDEDEREEEGLDSERVLEAQKQEWKAWVENSNHGASAIQVDQFCNLLNTIVSDVKLLSPDLVATQPVWGLPGAIWERLALPELDAAVNQMPSEESPPSPRLAYGQLTGFRANAPQRAHSRKMAARAELMDSKLNVGEIKIGDILLLKTVQGDDENVEGGVEGDGSEIGHGLQWWLGISQNYLPSKKREESLEDELEVQWMFPSSGGKMQMNDLNCKFTPWIKARVKGKGRKNEKNVESVGRSAVVMIGLKITTQKFITVESKKAIGEVGIGFIYNPSNKTLSYEAEDLAM